MEKQMNEDFQPVLYVIMRRDIYDMNPGKAIAQGAHAVSVFHEGMADIRVSLNEWPNGDNTPALFGLFRSFVRWKEESSSGCFGTTIVLHSVLEDFPIPDEGWNRDGMHLSDLRGTDTKALMGLALDDEYPFRNWNGEVFCQPEITACFVFAHNQEVRDYMKKYELHP